MKELGQVFQAAGDTAWAWRLRDRELNHGGELESGRMMTQYHRDAWRIALKHGKYALSRDQQAKWVDE
jgi:hypothetical protein